MRAAQVKVRVWRRKPVKVRAADRGEQQRMRLRRDNTVKAGVNGHDLASRAFFALSVRL